MAWRETVVISRNFDARGNPHLRADTKSMASFHMLSSPRKRGPIITVSGIWVPSISAFTRVHSPSKTGVNALNDALCAGTTAAGVWPLVHQHVAELPGIAGVEGFRKQLAAAEERRPAGVAADHWTEIRPLQVEATTEIHFIRLDDAALGILQHPHHAGEHGRRHLQAGRVLVGGEPPGFLDRELRTIPIGVLGVAVEQ